MKTKHKNPPAFPSTIGDRPHQGMTLRDYFAAKALQGQMSNVEYVISRWSKDDTSSGLFQDYLALTAYKVADAMLKQREL